MLLLPLPAPPLEADVRDKLLLRSVSWVTHERDGPDDPLKGIEMIARAKPTSSKGPRFCKIHFADVFPVPLCHWPVSELPPRHHFRGFISLLIFCCQKCVRKTTYTLNNSLRWGPTHPFWCVFRPLKPLDTWDKFFKRFVGSRRSGCATCRRVVESDWHG